MQLYYHEIHIPDTHSMHEEIKSILNMRNTCCHMIQNLLSSCVPSLNIDIKELTYESIILPVSLYAYQTWYLNLSKDHRLRVTKSFLCITHTVEHNYISPNKYSRNTTTCFGPICGLSSGCDLTYRAAIQDVLGVLLECWELGGGNEISLFQ